MQGRGMSEQQAGAGGTILAVNVVQRWREIADGRSTEAGVVLGAWSPWKGRSLTAMHFVPERIDTIIACRSREIMAIYDVIPDANGERFHWTSDARPRVVFHGQPSTRYRPEFQPAPPTWKRGEGVPVKLLPDDWLNGAPTGTVGEAVITEDGPQHITISVPAGYTVTINTRRPSDRRN